tara:strand:+ start:3102 stop:3620 length:519 start_codon:yes stop_codon:yes gene_type:complete
MSNKNIAIIYGSDTGATENVAKSIYEKIGENKVDLLEVNRVSPDDFKKYKIILIGVPTWYIGELQSDWDYFLPDFKTIDFKGIKTTYFGLGDQLGYPDSFVDGIGILAKIVLENGGEVFGSWSTDGYDFDESLGVNPDGDFYGLVIDDDNQHEMTDERIDKWLSQIKDQLSI